MLFAVAFAHAEFASQSYLPSGFAPGVSYNENNASASNMENKTRRVERQSDFCAYRGCMNGKFTTKSRLYRFPQRDDPRLAVWLENCGNKRLRSLAPSTLRACGLCEKHFEPIYFVGDKKRLARNAIPKLFVKSSQNPSPQPPVPEAAPILLSPSKKPQPAPQLTEKPHQNEPPTQLRDKSNENPKPPQLFIETKAPTKFIKILPKGTEFSVTNHDHPYRKPSPTNSEPIAQYRSWKIVAASNPANKTETSVPDHDHNYLRLSNSDSQHPEDHSKVSPNPTDNEETIVESEKPSKSDYQSTEHIHIKVLPHPMKNGENYNSKLLSLCGKPVALSDSQPSKKNYIKVLPNPSKSVESLPPKILSISEKPPKSDLQSVDKSHINVSSNPTKNGENVATKLLNLSERSSQNDNQLPKKTYIKVLPNSAKNVENLGFKILSACEKPSKSDSQSHAKNHVKVLPNPTKNGENLTSKLISLCEKPSKSDSQPTMKNYIIVSPNLSKNEENLTSKYLERPSKSDAQSPKKNLALVPTNPPRNEENSSSQFLNVCKRSASKDMQPEIGFSASATSPKVHKPSVGKTARAYTKLSLNCSESSDDNCDWTKIEPPLSPASLSSHLADQPSALHLQRLNYRLQAEMGRLRQSNATLKRKQTAKRVKMQVLMQRLRRATARNARLKIKARRETIDEFLDRQRCAEPDARTMVRLQLHRKNAPYSEEEQDLAKRLFTFSASTYTRLRRAGCSFPAESSVRGWIAEEKNMAAAAAAAAAMPEATLAGKIARVSNLSIEESVC